MKVWVQTWLLPNRGQLTSISKTKKQIADTLTEIRRKAKHDEEEPAKPLEAPYKISLPEDSPFAYKVQDGTVFLNDDEMDIIYS